MDDQQDRRRYDRAEVYWPVSVDIGSARIDGETVNISENGVAICCDEGLPLDRVVKVSIMPPDHQIIDVSGQVSWSDLCGIDDQDNTVGLGICFLEIEDSDRQFLAELIRKHSVTGTDG